MKPRLLDLFCGAGGAAMGYHRAGFEVVGVDIEPQPNYPFEFFQDDALEVICLGEFGPWDGKCVAVHASPPCQRYSSAGRRYAKTQGSHPDLIGLTRKILEQTGLPYVIENVGGAVHDLRQPVRICGSSVGLRVHRHRLFETNWPMIVPPCAHQGSGVAVYGKLDGRRLWTRADGSELRAVATLGEAQEAMGIDWMGWDELREAIPPAYTELIGHQLMQHLAYEKQAA
ncbi:MAG: DNA cytosine methyltransferase [Actinomycetota bacterium]|nr:DNA cytosine methyltransferase [Actinomycetota bacterium]